MPPPLSPHRPVEMIPKEARFEPVPTRGELYARAEYRGPSLGDVDYLTNMHAKRVGLTYI